MLAGKVAIVTGGAGGIGKAICSRFAAEGARVAVVDVNGEEATLHAAQLSSTYGANMAAAFAVDVSSERAVEDCVAQVVEKFGRIDVLVNNAVRFVFGHLLPPGTGSGTGTDREVTAESITQVMSVNVVGYVNFSKYAARAMYKNEPQGPTYENHQKRGSSTIKATSRGSIVNLCSVSSFIAQPEFVPYNCSKGALLQLTKCCAMDFAKIGVRVNSISPGSVETEGSHNHMSLLGLDLEAGRKQFGESNLLKRQAAPEEIANGALFLASDESSFMTGSNMVMDGGGTI